MTMTTNYLLFFLLMVSHVVIPAGLIAWLGGHAFKSKLGWLAWLVPTVLCVSFLFMAGMWHLASFYAAYLLVIACFACCIISYRRVRLKPFVPKPRLLAWLLPIIGLAGSAVMLYPNLLAVSSYRYEREPIRLAFPFRAGVYGIVQGGNGRYLPLMNYHFQDAQFRVLGINRSMQYAADIFKLSGWGTESTGLYPAQLEAYPIYGETLYSPCDGEVVDVRDGIADNRPYRDFVPGPRVGNSITLKTENGYVHMEHLQAGSLAVKRGDRVATGQALAKIGNSGLTNRPHLHILAVTEHVLYGEGVPILFDGQAPFKNRLFVRP